MAKVLEGPGMGLLGKWGLQTPNYVVVTSPDEFAQLASANSCMQLLEMELNLANDLIWVQTSGASPPISLMSLWTASLCFKFSGNFLAP